MRDAADLALCWRVEAACGAAWPTQFVRSVNGFDFRLSPGATTKRNNSVNPTIKHGALDQATLTAAIDYYCEHERDAIVRVPELMAPENALLDANGFGEPLSHSKTLYAPDLSPFEWADDVRISTQASSSWLQFAQNRAQWTEGGRQVFLDALRHIQYPILFGDIEVDDQLAAIAYAVVIDEIAIIESVETAPAFRRQGRAAHLLSSLLAKCRSLGATGAALQVLEANAPARTLYQKLGFSTELYDYYYRIKKCT